MARALAQAKIRRAINERPDHNLDAKGLKHGHIKLYSSSTPSLEPGRYEIDAFQEVTSVVDGVSSNIHISNYRTSGARDDSIETRDKNDPRLPQRFNVIAPRFSIDPKAVNLCYPPPGHQDEGRVLPHIVFNDPDLPWARPLRFKRDSGFVISPPLSLFSVIANSPQNSDLYPGEGEQDAPKRSKLSWPWVALMVFDPDELKLSSEDERALGIDTGAAPLRPASSSQPQRIPQQVSDTSAYSMTVKDFMSHISSRYDQDMEGIQPSQPTAVIFPKRDLVERLLKPTTQFAFMSHVRQVSTAGLPDAKAEKYETEYAICISKRSGPTIFSEASRAQNSTASLSTPKTQFVHLVSLEFLHEEDLSRNSPTDRIGLISLYSWTYSSVPSNPLNFQSTMTDLADGIQMLRTPEKALDELSGSVSHQRPQHLNSAAKHLHERLSLGYTLSRWRTSTGEETVAFMRGPLTPILTSETPSIADDWPDLSTTGKDYQILDRDLGIMDLTYSSAWQLGKVLAISDTVFNKALFRIRSSVHEMASNATRRGNTGASSRLEVSARLSGAIKTLKDAVNDSRAPARLRLPTSVDIETPLIPSRASRDFRNHLMEAIDHQAVTTESTYNGYTLDKPDNANWEVIHNWISDKLFLSGIPAQYLIPDPSWLPSEALRFFYIDSAWLDCLIDGALSLANHGDPADDQVRKRIKELYNTHLETDITVGSLTLKPPIPRYGFILRSSLMKVMPDLRITAACRTGPASEVQVAGSRDPLVRLKKMDEFTLLALFDCLPEDIIEISLTQPPHQQRYVAFEKLDPNPVYSVKQQFTISPPEGRWGELEPAQHTSLQDTASWYDAESRCLNIENMFEDITTALKQTDEFGNVEDAVTLAVQLDDGSYQLRIRPPEGEGVPARKLDTRQLRVRPDAGIAHDRTNALLPNETLRATSSLVAVASSPVTTNQGNWADPSFPRSTSNSAVHLAQTPSVPAPAAHLASIPSTRDSHFDLCIHPDYRGPAPRPYTVADGKTTYSSQDFIPTATKRPVDLIISLQQRSPNPAALGRLLSLTVTIPTDTSVSTEKPESLLVHKFDGVDVVMLSNLRLLPSLSASPGFLYVNLSPRSAISSDSASATTSLEHVKDASFTLKSCTIAKIVQHKNVDIVGGSRGRERSISIVKVTEIYRLPNDDLEYAKSSWNIVKRDGGDVDIRGRPV